MQRLVRGQPLPSLPETPQAATPRSHPCMVQPDILGLVAPRFDLAVPEGDLESPLKQEMAATLPLGGHYKSVQLVCHLGQVFDVDGWRNRSKMDSQYVVPEYRNTKVVGYPYDRSQLVLGSFD